MKRKLLLSVLVVLCTYLISSCAFAINAFPDGTYCVDEQSVRMQPDSTNDVHISIEVCRGNGYLRSTALTILPKRIVFYEDGTFATSGCVGKWAVEEDSNEKVTKLLLTGLYYEFETGEMTDPEAVYKFSRDSDKSRDMTTELFFDIEIE